MRATPKLHEYVSFCPHRRSHRPTGPDPWPTTTLPGGTGQRQILDDDENIRVSWNHCCICLPSHRFSSDPRLLSERLGIQPGLGRSDYQLTTYQRPQASGAGYLLRQFVRQVDADDGIAWCSGIEGDSATLLYTDMPGAVEEWRQVPVTCIRAAALSYQTRVWLPSKPFGWIPGEIAGLLPHGKYIVRSRGLGNLRSRPDQFRVRWNRPLGDPSVAVAHGLVESRDYYDARQPLVRNIVEQRAAYQGFHRGGIRRRASLPASTRCAVQGDQRPRHAVRARRRGRTGQDHRGRPGHAPTAPRRSARQHRGPGSAGAWSASGWRNLPTDWRWAGTCTRVLVAPHEAIADAMIRNPTCWSSTKRTGWSKLARRNEDLERRLTQARPETRRAAAADRHAHARRREQDSCACLT